MNGQVLNFDGPAHHAAEELLPWFVNGTLDGNDLALVERHLGECVQCQHEVNALRKLQAAYVDSELAPDPNPAFQKLRRRLDAPASSWDLWRTPRRNWSWKWLQRWTPWALAAQFAMILILGALLVDADHRTMLYRTLGAADVPRHQQGSLVVVFDPRTTEAELRQIVRATAARIVDGPTAADAYVLELPAGRVTTVLEALRAQRAVILAERLESGR